MKIIQEQIHFAKICLFIKTFITVFNNLNEYMSVEIKTIYDEVTLLLTGFSISICIPFFCITQGIISYFPS